ncbi:uncharacterized protein LOC132757290 [Ruditapes philippinarum]|uniref:uncharacterized protein LOC132757290 n=1 Tax=Ruditapes philippinarum TaxID=129788 RepID=UPI00295A6E8B|nr:uncharacterized protein LOC132757290 [Ruditapes philippinarum]
MLIPALIIMEIIVTEAAISPLETTYTATVDENYTIPWQYDNPADMDQVFWTFKSSKGATSATIMTRDNGSLAQVFDFNVEHVDDGNIKLINVRMNNSGIYFCQVSYSFTSGIPTVTGTATLSITQRLGI